MQDRALISDSIATTVGAVLGTSTTTSYIESSAGVAAGARTGFASLVTAGFFILIAILLPVIIGRYSTGNSTCVNYCWGVNGFFIRKN